MQKLFANTSFKLGCEYRSEVWHSLHKLAYSLRRQTPQRFRAERTRELVDNGYHPPIPSATKTCFADVDASATNLCLLRPKLLISH
jgi:hypothetical protein